MLSAKQVARYGDEGFLSPVDIMGERSMVTVSVLAALGREPQLRDHLRGALNVGIALEKLEEILIHVTHYAGWPAASTGLRVLRELLAERRGEGG